MIALAPTQQRRGRDALREARRDEMREHLRCIDPQLVRVSQRERFEPVSVRPSLKQPPPSDNQQPPSPTLADVFGTFSPEYRRRYDPLPVQQDRLLREVMACFTPRMGRHEWTCDRCGSVVELPNGCNNRHCPSCGGLKRIKWAEQIASEILPVPHNHVILTVPHEITLLAMANPTVLYPLMLKGGAETIMRCGRKLFKAELALLSLLHTWGNLLNRHLHSHILLPSGGLWTKGYQWIPLSTDQIEDLLLLVEFRFPRRLMQGLRKAHQRGQLKLKEGQMTLEGMGATEEMEEVVEQLPTAANFEEWLDSINTERWVIRCPQVWDRRGANQDPDAMAKTVTYLANYANRVAVSNDRIVGIEGDNVLLRYKDYRDGNQWKTTSIDGVEFIGRFLRHLLPQGFHHIRRYGWMNGHAKQEKRDWLREHFQKNDASVHNTATNEENGAQREEAMLRERSEEPTRSCRYCENGTLRLTRATRRPKVSEILRMPLSWFVGLKAGAIVTLSEKAQQLAELAQKENAETGREPSSLPISGYL